MYSSCIIPKLGSKMPNMGISTTATRKTSARSAVKRAPARPRVSMAGALFTTTQQRVLGLLFGQPERSFFATEIIMLAQAGSGAVQRELQRLTESGLITVSRVGNQKHYQANKAAPIFEELRGMVLKMLGPAEVLRAALTPLTEHLHAAWLYGSVAKGGDRAQSDIDVLVVADNLTLEEIYAALGPAEKKLSRTVSPTLYTVKEFERRRASGNSFLAKVLAGEPIPLFLKNHATGSPG